MAQGVAFCARRMGIPATIIAPDTAPATKMRAVQRLGGRVIQVPFAEWWNTFETRSYPGVDATFIHAFDDLDVMAGNGVIALELLEDLPRPRRGGDSLGWRRPVLRDRRGASAPRVLRVRIYAAEVDTAAPLAAALAAGEPCTVDYQGRHRLVDGILWQQDRVSQYVRARAETARRIAGGDFGRSRASHEGGSGTQPSDCVEGACGVRACCRGPEDALSGRAGLGKVAAIVSGGNIDLDKFAQLRDKVHDREEGTRRLWRAADKHLKMNTDVNPQGSGEDQAYSDIRHLRTLRKNPAFGVRWAARARGGAKRDIQRGDGDSRRCHPRSDRRERGRPRRSAIAAAGAEKKSRGQPQANPRSKRIPSCRRARDSRQPSIGWG